MRNKRIRPLTIKKPQKLNRIDSDEYFLKIASVVAERSTCRRHHIGAIAVKEKRILATGFNGAPSGFTDCLTLGCLRDQLNIPSSERPEICRAIHAEQNVIIQAGLHGVSLEGSIIYCTHTPCLQCAKMLVNSKIKRCVSYNKYDDTKLREFVNLSGFTDLFKDAGITIEIIKRPSSEITYLD
jgi:dCMP deaminase